jgi:hypothetical protein
MKPYILNYSETIDLKNTAQDRKNRDEFQFYNFGGTWVTESIEPSDDDEISFMRDSTELTFVREPDDPDEIDFMADSTLMTKSIEPSDEDEVFYDSYTKKIALM